VYFYISPQEMKHFIREVRGSLPIVANVPFASTFSIPPFCRLEEPSIRMQKLAREMNTRSG
jgi:hypothetical protein